MRIVVNVTFWIASYVVAALIGTMTLIALWSIQSGYIGDPIFAVRGSIVAAAYVTVLGFPFALVFSVIPELLGVRPNMLFYGFGGMVAGFVGGWIMQYSLILPDGVLATIELRTPFMVAGIAAGIALAILRQLAWKK